MNLAPAEITLARDHRYKKPAKGRKCVACGQDKLHPDHGPFSYREFGSGANRWLYQATKRAWEDQLIRLLSTTDLPRPCTHVFVEGIMCFPDRRKRDQGNMRFAVEKFLGDALQRGGWLLDDSWAEYSFGDLEYRYEKDRSWTRLVLFPTAHALEVAA